VAPLLQAKICEDSLRSIEGFFAVDGNGDEIDPPIIDWETEIDYEVEEIESGSIIRQTAIFDAVGLSGFLYWYLLYPLHMLIFKGTLSGIAKTLTQEQNP